MGGSGERAGGLQSPPGRIDPARWYPRSGFEAVRGILTSLGRRRTSSQRPTTTNDPPFSCI